MHVRFFQLLLAFAGALKYRDEISNQLLQPIAAIENCLLVMLKMYGCLFDTVFNKRAKIPNIFV